MLASGDAPRRRVARQFLRGLRGRDPDAGREPELPDDVPTLGIMLREAGYDVAYKGKWHLTQRLHGGEWSAADTEAIGRRFGFAEWEPPDAGENAKAENFGGGNGGTSGWAGTNVRTFGAFLVPQTAAQPRAEVAEPIQGTRPGTKVAPIGIPAPTRKGPHSRPFS